MANVPNLRTAADTNPFISEVFDETADSFSTWKPLWLNNALKDLLNHVEHLRR